MFDLAQSIAEWRQRLVAGEIKAPQVLDELESHLRDEVERQVRAGSDAPQAFEIAIQRLGQARALGMEFKKVAAIERTEMKRIMAIIAALVGMVFGLSVVLPQLGQWSRTGVMHSVAVLWLGVALVIVGGSVAFHGIRTHREARGRKLIGVGIVAAGGFYAMPFIFAFFQSQETNLMGWVFCAGLAAASILFFGCCFYFNRRLPTQPVHET